MENTGMYDINGNELSFTDVINKLDTSTINRVEVIDEKGRSYVNWKPSNQTQIMIQDNNRTLKIFISQRPNINPLYPMTNW